MRPELTYEQWSMFIPVHYEGPKCCKCGLHFVTGDIYRKGPTYRDGRPADMAHELCIQKMRPNTDK